MPLLIILGVIFVLCMIWPRATRVLVIAPINGLVLGGLGWSILAIMNPGFNSLGAFLMCTGLMTAAFIIFLLKDA
jgi:hypothetical protein